jgi:D-proline reductase (dithiol) PrdB
VQETVKTEQANESWLEMAARQVQPGYSIVHNSKSPWTPLMVPVKECRVTLVTTAAVHHRYDDPFSPSTDLGPRRPRSFGPVGYDEAGEYSYHTIWTTSPTSVLTVTAADYDSAAAQTDINCIFPVDRLHELDQKTEIRSVAPRAFSFYGLLGDMNRLEKTSAAELRRLLREDRVDLVVLAPGGPISHQALGVIQRAIEASGIPTVSLTLAPDVTSRVMVPRAVYVKGEMGKPFGEPGDISRQLLVLRFLLDALSYAREAGTIVEMPEPAAGAAG